MSEHVLAQPQRANAPQETTKVVGSLQLQDMNQPEPTTLQEWLLDTVSGTFAEPRFGFDFSGVPALTGMVRQNRPLLRTQPMLQRSPKEGIGGSSPCPTCPEAETTEISEPAEPTGETAPLTETTEPIPEPPSPGVETTPLPAQAETESITPGETPASALIVEDSAADLASGQMKKSEFLAQLRTEVTRAAEDAMAGTGRTTKDCPYLEYWFGFYSGKDSAHIERAIHKYAPEKATAATARDYIPIITARVRQSVELWARTGEITGVPEGLSMGLPGMGPPGGIGRLISGIGSIFFKAREGGARKPDDPRAIQAQLGEGRPLNSGVRSRMESAFGMDFSHVRTHTDRTAADISSRFNARAFTLGRHVAFGAGEYNPGTPVGDVLIAHELAHVVQQGGANTITASNDVENTSRDSLETDADQSAASAVVSLWNNTGKTMPGIPKNAMPRSRSGLRLQRCSVFSESSRQRYHGYDDSINPNGLVVPLNGTREVRVRKSKKNMTIISHPPDIVEVEEKKDYMDVTGKKHDKTRISAKIGKKTVERLDVSVKRKIDYTVDYHYMSDSAKPEPHSTERSPGDESKFTDILNEVWERQANIRFKKGKVDSPKVKIDLGNVIVAERPSDPKARAIEAFAVTGGDYHVFLVWDYEKYPWSPDREEVGGGHSGKCTILDDSVPIIGFAHEAGHFLKLSHHNKEGIMNKYSNEQTKRVFKSEADKVNK